MLYTALHDISEVKAYFSTKYISEGTELNFSKNERADAKKKLARILNTEEDKLIFCRQTHSANTAIVTNANYGQAFNDTDALISNSPGIVLNVITADCCPILLYCPVSKSVGAIHAGWKGSSKGIIAKTIALMQSSFNAEPKSMHAAIGPCISAGVYEVGQDVKDAYTELKLNTNLLFTAGKVNDKYYLNLAEANRQQLLNSGIDPLNIAHENRCTFTEEANFYSARKQGIDTGRMANGIMLV